MENVTHPPLHQRVGHQLRERIENGVWVPGAPLPSEAELCREFGTSRGPVRQALAALRAEGLITGGRGKPPTVRGQANSQSFATFRSFTEWARSIGRVPGQRTLELARRGLSAQAAGYLGLQPGDTGVEVLRLRLLDGVPAMLERTTFELSVGRLLFDFDTDSGSIFDHLTAQGVDLHRGRHTIDAVAADAEEAHLLQHPVGSPLLRERRLTTTEAGVGVEYSDDRYLPGLTNFVIENDVQHRASLVRAPTT